jgi:hypothetical protein
MVSVYFDILSKIFHHFLTQPKIYIFFLVCHVTHHNVDLDRPATEIKMFKKYLFKKTLLSVLRWSF